MLFMNDKNGSLIQHVLFGASTLLALVVVASIFGEIFGWWQNPLGIVGVISVTVGSLLLTLIASRLRRDRLGPAT